MKNQIKRKVLIIMGRYLPGYKDGGPVRSIKNLVDYLGDEYDFRILTCDRDHGDVEPYKNITVNDWNEVGNAKVYYVPPKKFKYNVIKKLSNDADVVYVCGCFNDYAIKTLILKRFKFIKKPVVVAAMGLFSPKAFEIKYFKKKLYVILMYIFGFFKDVYWSATSKMEVAEIKAQIKVDNSKFYVAEDLPRKVNKINNKSKKEKGQINIVWISRIAQKKNLKYAIEILSKIKKDSIVKFSIYGPIFEEEYWEECVKLLNELPPNINWNYEGEVNSEEVVDVLRNYNLFLFPTLGENYGHVIQEALSAGCVCILSDQTPWKDLEQKGVGYVFSLDNQTDFVKAIQYYIDMNEEQMKKSSQKAVEYAIINSNEKVRKTGYRKMFDSL